MLPIMITICSLWMIPTVCADADYVGQYIDISMAMTIAMKDTGASEEELHQLAKQVVLYGYDSGKVQQLYDDYLENKTEEIKDAFIKNYLHDKRIEYVKERVGKVLGYYLTKEQIRKVRLVLEQEAGKGSSQEEVIAAVKKEVAKEVGERKAEKAVENTIKDLRILVNLKLGIFVRHEEDIQPLIESEKEKKEELAPEKKEEEMPFLKYAEAPTQEELKAEGESPELPLAGTAPPSEAEDALGVGTEKKKKKRKAKEQSAVKPDKTLQSARMSIRLPRAPKGHHEEELEQMEKFLAEDDISAIEK
ncbi:unnamed protein product [Cylicocyclus nassatus]|uniref:Uncharacterized protein n=1 Tax=Cylicocyclus nassatus TaxID=53992 RepID=A0AA36HD92_CYLNA|nr:unnamed protein product [Cylicocyclus nassatus]